jgi:hypothetical protein
MGNPPDGVSDGSIARRYARVVRNVSYLAVVSLVWLLSPTLSDAAELSVGDPAPPFELAGSDGTTYTLEGLREWHRGVVLAWFPKAFTPG